MRRPGFFIVGAPKCGTSALDDFLRQHPDIFIPPFKEIHFFGSDLMWPNRPSANDYLQCFSGWKDQRIAGETSVYYLYSNAAAADIKAFSPDARIIIMLRNPVDAMYSLYFQVLFNMQEDIESFDAALAAESNRIRGIGVPPVNTKPQQLFYRSTVRYSQQVRRYFDTFGRERVLVIIYDDFQTQTLQAYQRALRFLGVDEAFVPHMRVVNPNKRYRSRMLQNVLTHPPRWLVTSARRWVPPAIVRELSERGYRLNSKIAARPPMAPGLRTTLLAEFLPEVEHLSALLGRDLTHWCRG